MYPGVHARSIPDKPASIFGASGEVVSYAQLDARSNQAAHLFRRLGLGRGDAVALFMENQPRWLDVAWGAQRSGLYYTPIATHLTADEVAYIAGDCGARVLVTSYALREAAAGLAERMPRVHTRLMTGGTIADFAALEPALAAEPIHAIADEVEGAEMLYSSGTTGRPKGIQNPLPELPIGTPPPLLRALADGMFGVSPDTVYLSPAPLYHSAPLRFVMTLQRLGATCVVMERFDAEQALALIERHRVTMSQWVPTMFVKMLKLPPEVRARYDLSSHTTALHAAAPCPVAVKEQMIEWWGPILVEYYGATEGNGSTQIDSHEWLAHRGSVGRPVNCNLHIVDEEGRELPAGEVGLVCFSGGEDFEYHNDPDKTARSRLGAGRSTVGDVGYVDADGYLYLTDRKDNMIVTGGVNVYPQETEDVLVLHPKVGDVAVFGVPHEEFGEEVKAVVEPAPEAVPGPELERELLAFCRERLSKLKCPRSIDFEAALPRTETGKLLKRRLREKYWEGHATRIV